MSDFESRVLPVLTKAVKQRLYDEALQADAIGLCWYRYQQTPRRLELSATQVVNMAIRQVLCGRRLPGEKTHKRHGGDVLDHPDTWRAGSMEGLRARTPPPDVQAMYREELARLRASEGTRVRFIEMALEGMRTQDIAKELGVSEARVSQMRREAMERG